MPRVLLTEDEKKEHIKLSQVKWRDKNKDKIVEYNLTFREKNPTYHTAYFKTKQGRKSNRINGWKQKGVVHPNFDLLYDQYLNTSHCTNCTVELCEGKKTNSRCLDHLHEAPSYPMLTNFRAVICTKCNVRRK